MHKIVKILLLWTCLWHSKEYASNGELTTTSTSTLPTPTFANASSNFYNSNAELMQAEDTEMLQAPQQSTRRNSRQLFYDPSLFFLPNFNVEGSKCYTSRGTTGVCVRFSGCRTYYRVGRQITFVDLRQWPQSVALNDEICSFYDSYGRANNGICCTNSAGGGNDFGFGIVPAQPPVFVPGPVRPIPAPPPVDNGNPDRDREEIDHSTDDDAIDATIDIDGNNIHDNSPDFHDENNVGYDPIKDDADELPTPVTYDDRYEWSTQQFPGQFGGFPQWPPQVPTHPSTPAVWPPPIPTHPPNHHYPTHPPTVTRPTARPTTRPTTRPTAIPTTIPTTRRSSTITTTRRPITTTTTRRPSYPSYPGFPSYPGSPAYPGYPGSPSYPPYPPRPPQTTTTTTRRPPAQAPSMPVGGSTGANGLPKQCGIKNPVSPDQERIVGGTNASPHEFPWIAVLFKSGKQFCGGSLITNNHILTAAHCVARMTSWDVAALTAHLGDYNIRTDFEVQHVQRRIKRLVRHKGFDFSTLHNDIAILTLNEPVKFTYEIQPICLPTSTLQQGRSYSGLVATVAGWGSLRENGPQPSILQKVQIPIWGNNECARKYGRAAPGGIIESMICAGQAAKDSCSGDSGGPMILNDGGLYTQVGIVSWGIGCGKGEYPGVYTRITSLLPWIYKNIK